MLTGHMRRFTFAVGVILVLAGVSLGDTLITSGGKKYDGIVTEDGDNYVLFRPNGGRMVFPKSMVARIEKTPQPSGFIVIPSSDSAPASQPQDKPSNAVSVSFSGASRSKEPAGNEKLFERIVTGIGTDPDKAIQAAFSQAIESTVGVLVDAETVVKNDQIIKDQILTFSRGFIKSFEVVKQWQADGLHHATIKALVEMGKLTDKLKANNIATHEIPGELLGRQFTFEIKNEADAAKMLKGVLKDFDITKLTKVEVVGQPDIKRKGENAEITISVKISPNVEEWEKYAKDLTFFLDKVSTRRAAVILENNFLQKNSPGSLSKQLDGEGSLIGVPKNVATAGDQTQWDVYRVPQSLEKALKASPPWNTEPWQREYRLATVLLDNNGGQVLRATQVLKTSWYHEVGVQTEAEAVGFGIVQSVRFYSISPFWRSIIGNNYPVFKTTVSVSLSPEELKNVAKVAVSLDREKKE